MNINQKKKPITGPEFDFLLKEGESYFIEFKAKFDKSLSREITAFANASGGRIFLGVDDYGNVKGIELSNRLKSQLQDLANNCQPSIPIYIEPFQNICIIHVTEGLDKPYQCSEGFFIRMGSNSQKMSRDQIIDFIQSEGRARFDEQFHSKFNYKKDYKPSKLAGFLKFAGVIPNLDDETILINLGVADKSDSIIN